MGPGSQVGAGLALPVAGYVIDGLLNVALAIFCTAEERSRLSKLSDAVMANLVCCTAKHST